MATAANSMGQGLTTQPPLAVRHAWAPVWVWAAVLVAMALLLLISGAFAPERLPRGISSSRQLLGVNLLLLLVPSYLIGAWVYLQRRSWRLLGEVNALVPDVDYRTGLSAPGSMLIGGALIGLVYAVLFNLPVRSMDDLIRGGPPLVGIVIGMVFVWMTAGLVIASRVHVAGQFRRAGNEVPIDPYDQSPLEPFARSGMSDMLLTVGALVLSTVQSVDAMFRFENYLYALAVAVPAGLFLLLRPMSSIHLRLRERKQAELTQINKLIRRSPKDLTQRAVAELEPLLQRRDRVRALPTWPLDTAMVSRLIFYGVIPPAAWVAAALVEQLVSGLLGE